MRTTGPGQSALLLLDVVAILNDERIDYAVIGAMAASVYGSVRASLDADAVLSLAIQEMRKLEIRFKTAQFQTEFRQGDSGDPIAALLTIYDSFGNRVDLLSGLRGMEAEAFSRSIEVPLQGSILRVIGLEDFVAMKLFAGGPLDLDDARNVIAVSGTRINRTLLQKLTERYGATAVKSLHMLLRK